MDFYTSTDVFDGYNQSQANTAKNEISKNRLRPILLNRKSDGFSNLSAEERWNYTKKINALQRLINEIQTVKEPDIDKNTFTLTEVLEVLNVRMAMSKRNK